MTSCLRAPPDAPRPPAGDALRERRRVVASRSVRGPVTRAPTIVAPTSQRPQVARDGLDLGKLGHAAAA